jgi:hypothetical protein
METVWEQASDLARRWASLADSVLAGLKTQALKTELASVTANPVELERALAKGQVLS